MLRYMQQQQQQASPPPQPAEPQKPPYPGGPLNFDIGLPPDPPREDPTQTRVGQHVNTAFRNQDQPFRQAFAEGPRVGAFGREAKDALARFKIQRKDCDLRKFSGKMADFKM